MIRYGTPCILLDPKGATLDGTRMRTCTATSFRKLNVLEQRRKIAELTASNSEALLRQLQVIATWPSQRRMFRMTSGLFPLVSLPEAKPYYADKKVLQDAYEWLAKAGKVARSNKIRLSFHPDQFINLTAKDITNSKTELTTHVRLFEAMGYNTDKWHHHNICINIHGGKRDYSIETWLKRLESIGERLGNTLTVENDEYSWDVKRLLKLSRVPVVLDVHHYWIYHGRYFDPDDVKLVQRIVDSWRGAKPKIHLSTPRYEVIKNVDDDAIETGKYHDKRLVKGSMLDYASLIEGGISRGRLRQHSDYLWHRGLNRHALDVAEALGADIMFETKAKNLATERFAA